jgi:hypothetical protein
MVIINTSADEVRIQAVSPLSICGSGATAGAVAIAASGPEIDGVTSCASAAATGTVARKRIKNIARICCVTTNPLLATTRSKA